MKRSSTTTMRAAVRALSDRVDSAASRLPFALSARWRICAILRGVYGCKVPDLDEAQATDALQIVGLVDRRVAWYLDQRRGVTEDQMRWIGARDVAALLPTDAGRDYTQLDAMPALPALRMQMPARPTARVIDLAAFSSARKVARIQPSAAAVIRLADRRRADVIETRSTMESGT